MKTHCPCAVWRRITYDICIMGHGMLPNKTIGAISVDHPRQIRRINRNARSSGILVQVF